MNRHLKTLVQAATVFGAIALTWPAARAQALPGPVQAAASKFLLQACDDGERTDFPALFRQYSGPLEQFFIDAIRNGPDPKLLAAQEDAASHRFDLLQAGKGAGVRRIPYLLKAEEAFVISYKERAVGALALVAGTKGRTFLQALAADARSPLRSDAQNALSRTR